MQASRLPRDDKPSGAGRPRDPSLEGRVYDAAIQLYAKDGWRGFTFEAVARASGVGKGALYRRWSGRPELLAATLEARWGGVAKIDTGGLKGDLLALADLVFDLLMNTQAGVAVHIQSDAQVFEEVRAVTTPFRSRVLDNLRLIMTRAIARGELPPKTSTRLLADVLVGAITNHVMATPVEQRETALARSKTYTLALVEIVLNGVSLRAAD